MLVADAQEFDKSVNFAGYMGQRIRGVFVGKMVAAERGCVLKLV